VEGLRVVKSRINGSPVACTGYLGALLFIAVSASQNVLTGYDLGSARSELHALIFAAGSLAGALCQPVAWFAAWQAFRTWQIGRGVLAVVLGAACLAYATLSSLGFVSTARLDMAAERTKSGDSYEFARARADAAITELKALAAAPIGTKKVEAKRAERRSDLERTIAEAQNALQTGSATDTADPQAASIAAYAAALGFPVASEKIAPWLSVVAVVFFECGAGLSLIVVSIIATVPAQTCQPEIPIEDEVPNAPEPPATKRGRRRTALPDDILARIRDAGGELNGTLNSIGDVIGLNSKTTAHRALRELEAAGALKLEPSADGTRVVLAS
jgi:hypothetical protein